MLRCTHEHPHHGLPIFLALAHAKEDERLLGGKRVKEKAVAREEAATRILMEVEKIAERRVQVERYRVISLGRGVD